MAIKKGTQVIYVYSGKGGVGKSTFCVNLAYAFSLQGHKTAIFDADLSGPSLPTLVRGVEEQSPRMEQFTVKPGIYAGVEVNSIGLISDPIDSSFWTGRYLKGVLYQLFFSVDWEAEVLLIDLPPGTSDIHREMFTQMPGKAIIVTTPQEISYVDINRSIDFLERLDIDIVGMVENMSYYQCEACGCKEKIFVGNTRARLCDVHNIELLAELPIESQLNRLSNIGEPFILQEKESETASIYLTLTSQIFNRCNVVKNRKGSF